MGAIIGEYIGATTGIQSPIPTKNQTEDSKDAVSCTLAEERVSLHTLPAGRAVLNS